MPFASDGVGIVGGVPAIGDGNHGHAGNHYLSVGVENALIPLADRNVRPDGHTRPMFQHPVKIWAPFEKANEKQPGLGFFSQVFLHIAAAFGYTGPEKTRKNNIPTEFERVTFLTGLPAPTMEAWEPATNEQPGIDLGENMNDGNIGTVTLGPDPILNFPPDEPNDLSQQKQSVRTNEFEQLHVFRSSFPHVPVQQAETTSRSIVLSKPTAGSNFMGEMSIPDGTSAVRITWTGMRSGTDLWVSFGAGGTLIPSAANQPGGLTSGLPAQADPTQDGAILNPDDTKKYFVSGKRFISLMSLTQTTVNIQCYQQA